MKISSHHFTYSKKQRCAEEVSQHIFLYCPLPHQDSKDARPTDDSLWWLQVFQLVFKRTLGPIYSGGGKGQVTITVEAFTFNSLNFHSKISVSNHLAWILTLKHELVITWPTFSVYILLCVVKSYRYDWWFLVRVIKNIHSNFSYKIPVLIVG